MNEQEWLECADPDTLLWLPLLRNKISDRKRRLFACACCRRMWNLLTDDRSRALIEETEKYADGVVTQKELEAAEEVARHAETLPVITCRTTLGPLVHYTPGSVALAVGATPARYSPRGTAILARVFAVEVAGDQEVYIIERKEQAVLVRDLILNPFRPITINPAWLGRNDGTVRRIAQAIYDDRAFDRMPILADALEEAGCGDADILNHCRSEGPHVKGCWVVDAVLGKE